MKVVARASNDLNGLGLTTTSIGCLDAGSKGFIEATITNITDVDLSIGLDDHFLSIEFWVLERTPKFENAAMVHQGPL